MAVNALVVTDNQGGGIDYGDTVTTAFESLEQGRQRRRAARHEFHETVITGQTGKLCSQMATDVVLVEDFELTETQLMKEDSQSHQL
jgi:hypothetical protein